MIVIILVVPKIVLPPMHSLRFVMLFLKVLTFTRILFTDFTKAFDVINHNVLHDKLVEY
jgi:hypothetical protein